MLRELVKGFAYRRPLERVHLHLRVWLVAAVRQGIAAVEWCCRWQQKTAQKKKCQLAPVDADHKRYTGTFEHRTLVLMALTRPL